MMKGCFVVQSAKAVQATQAFKHPLAVAQEGKRWNGCIYVRISKEDGDKEESDSITNQKALIRDFSETLTDVDIIAEFVDDGHSGASFERPDFQKMMEAIKAGRINCVIVKDLSRLSCRMLTNLSSPKKFLTRCR